MKNEIRFSFTSLTNRTRLLRSYDPDKEIIHFITKIKL